MQTFTEVGIAYAQYVAHLEVLALVNGNENT